MTGSSGRDVGAPYDLATAAHDFPEWEGRPKRTILICTHPRSGSTLLGEAIYFAGDLGCPLEYFHRGFRPAFEKRWTVQGIGALAAAVHRWRTAPNGVLSAKLFWQDIEEIMRELRPGQYPRSGWIPADETTPQTYRDIHACIASIFPNATWVHLTRGDRVRQAVSSLAATQSGSWREIPAGDDTSPADGLDYDYDRIAASMALADYAAGHWAKFFDSIGVYPLAVTYEDVVRDYEGTIAGILRYLGSDVPVPAVRMGRQSDAQKEALVLRFLRDNQVRHATSIGR